MPRKVIFDTDPGIDDALALLLLAVSPEIELLGITVTHGNTSQEKCLRNALSLVELAGISHVEVARGAEEPLVKELSVAEETHGDGGLGYASLPPSNKAISKAMPRHKRSTTYFAIQKRSILSCALGLNSLLSPLM